MNPIAIGYVRVSTDEQVDGYGADAQRAAIRDRCKGRLRLLDVECDLGISGAAPLDQRPGLASALSRCEAGEASALVCYRLDRIARDMLLSEVIAARLEACKVRLISATEPDFDPKDPTRVLIRQIFAAFGQYERAILRQRRQSGWQAKRDAGGYIGGRPPYGWVVVGKELVQYEPEQEVIALVRKLRAEGASLRAIGIELAERGITSRVGGTWLPGMVRGLLTDRVVNA